MEHLADVIGPSSELQFARCEKQGEQSYHLSRELWLCQCPGRVFSIHHSSALRQSQYLPVKYLLNVGTDLNYYWASMSHNH